MAEEPLAIMPENHDAVRVFCAAGTQWRLAPSGAPLGLDYQGVLAVLAFLGLAPSADLLDRLRVMEAEARRVLAGLVKRAQRRAARSPKRGRP